MSRLSDHSQRTGRLSRRLALRPQAEALESRHLLAVTINEFPVTPTSSPFEMTKGPDNNLWFTDRGTDSIGMINPTTHAVTEFHLPAGETVPFQITSANGHLYFTLYGSSQVDRISTAGVFDGAGAGFPVALPGAKPKGITTGPDGKLYVAEDATGVIDQIDPTNGARVPFSGPIGANEITTGPDGNLWYTVLNDVAPGSPGFVGMLNRGTGSITPFPLPAGQTMPHGITTGPDGNLWVAVGDTNQIDRITLNGSITPFTVPTAHSKPEGITTGPDGNLWFAEGTADRIGVFNPTTFHFAEYPTPTAHSSPLWITTGPDDNLWFTEPGAGNIGQVQIIGPTVSSVQRLGVHATPTTLRLTFDTALDPARAANSANYQLVRLGRSGRPITTIGIGSAVYNDANHTVTLSPRQRLSLFQSYRLTVNGTGPTALTDTVGHLLGAPTPGTFGRNFVTRVTAANLVL